MSESIDPSGYPQPGLAYSLPRSLSPGDAKRLTRVRALVAGFIIGLVISGATAIPLVWEMNLLGSLLPVPASSDNSATAGLTRWVLHVRDGVVDSDARYPFLAYGTDWLAFGHFVIALVFVGAYRDPVRNIWLFTFGMISCIMVIPYALVFGWVRQIPFGWRLIDCSFGLVGFPLLWLARREALRLQSSVAY